MGPRRLVAVLAFNSADFSHAMLAFLNAVLKSITLLSGHGSLVHNLTIAEPEQVPR